MKKILHAESSVEYDQELRFNIPCKFKCGDEIPSGIRDDFGTMWQFTGSAFVECVQEDFGNRTCALYVKRFPPIYVDLSIEMHPAFQKPRFDWGVKRGEYNDDTDEFDPDDRSGYMPEHDGKALCDFWDYEKKEWKSDFPMIKTMRGIISFKALNPEVSPSNHYFGSNPLF